MRFFFSFLFLTLAYGATAALGLQWAIVGGAGSPVWPAAGVGLAGLILGGLRLWPAIIAGRLLAAVLTGSDQSLPVEVVIATGNALATLAGAAAVRLNDRDTALSTMRGVLVLILGAALLAAISGLIGTGALAAGSGLDARAALTLFRDWWLGAFVGAVVVAPLLLSWQPGDGRISWPQAGRLALMAALAAALSYVVFLTPGLPELRPWLTFPVLIWAALSFETRGAAIAVTIVTATAILGASLGIGPFFDSAPGPAERLFLSQQFSAMAAVTTLLLAAAAAERRGRQALGAAKARLQAVLEAARLGAWHWDIRTGAVEFDRRWQEILGYTPGSFAQNWDTFERLCHPEDLPRVRAALEDYFEGRTNLYSVELRMRHRDGHWIWVLTSGGAVARDKAGRPTILTGTHQDITDRISQREALEASEARARNIVESISDGFITLDGEWRVTYINPLGERILRPLLPTDQSLIGGDLWKMFPGLKDSDFGEAYFKAGTEKTMQAVEGYYPPLDSWFDLRCYPLADGVAGHFLDISGRKRAEAARAESEQQLRLALEAAMAGTFQVYADPARPPAVSSGARRLFGFADEEAPALDDFVSRIDPDDRPAVAAAIEGSFARGEGHYVEYRVRRPDGAVIWIASRSEAVVGEDGLTECLRGAVIDISERKAAERDRERLLDEVTRTGALVTAISESSTDPIFAKDAEGRMLLANSATLAAVGKTAPEVIGRTDAEWVEDAGVSEDLMRNDQAVMARSEPLQFEEIVRGPDGERVFLSTKAPLRDAEGRAIGLVGISKDITERKADEERLRLLNKELNHRVKNLFAIMRGLITMTARGESDPAVLADKLRDRISALAAAHMVSMDDEQLEPVPLEEVLRAVVAPYEHAHGRLTIEGPEVAVPRRFVTPLGLILHELATNAFKYGAWADGDGKVLVRWQEAIQQAETRCVLIEWQESAVGTAQNEGGAEGFGSQLMRASAKQIGGSFEQEWREGGLFTRLTLPLGGEGARMAQPASPRIAEETER